MILRIFILFVFSQSIVLAQNNKFVWSRDYEFSLQDFRGSATEVNPEVSSMISQPGIAIELFFEMSKLQFMFTKNFNSKISCSFQMDASVLVAQNKTQVENMIHLTKFDFDLSELYARKIRKELHQNKKTLSKGTFFRKYYEEMIAQRNERSSRVYAETELGKDKELLEKEHEVVKEEIEKYSDYCFECKPPKKRRKKS